MSKKVETKKKSDGWDFSGSCGVCHATKKAESQGGSLSARELTEAFKKLNSKDDLRIEK